MAALAEFESLVKFYGSHQALGPLSLSLPGGAVGLLGPNGAGKTTLLRILMGVIPPTSGTVRILGEEVNPGAKAVRRKIGYAPEGEALFPELSGVEAVSFAGRLVGMGKVESIERAHQVLDYVDLGEARYRRVETFSTGMRQRLKLAQALVHDPALLVLDEPTEGVDPEARIALLELIAELRAEHGLQVLLSTHLLNDVERLATHALVLRDGRAVTHGPLSELKRAPAGGYLVRVAGGMDKLQEALTARGVAWEPAAANLRVSLDDPREVLRIVAQAGLVVRHLAPFELTLDEAFTQAVAGGASNA
ncbi:MAG TPA: ABC transporter ATP-binding protein [Candidatus Thermoplasmatota archaeon]|nr:ABC transporter ATP-binding protein [Candidatus Thermoplasmatota archaeon]